MPASDIWAVSQAPKAQQLNRPGQRPGNSVDATLFSPARASRRRAQQVNRPGQRPGDSSI